MDINRKQQIATAAEKLFLHYGIKKTTISDISREAGIGKGSVYLEFKSKEEILFYLAGRQFQKMSVEIYQEIQGITDPFDKVTCLLKGYILGTFDFVKAWPHAEEIYQILVSDAGAEQCKQDSQEQVLIDALKAFADEAFELRQIPRQKSNEEIELILFMADALLPPYCHTLENRETVESLTNRYCEMAIIYLKN